jgi:hypothetical protein
MSRDRIFTTVLPVLARLLQLALAPLLPLLVFLCLLPHLRWPTVIVDGAQLAGVKRARKRQEPRLGASVRLTQNMQVGPSIPVGTQR